MASAAPGASGASGPEASPNSKPVFAQAPDLDVQALEKELDALLLGGYGAGGSESSGGRWRLTESGKGIERNFRFKGFKKTWVSVPLVFHSVYFYFF